MYAIVVRSELASAGLRLISTAVIGGVMHVVCSWMSLELSWPEAFLLGSILSATDPVAVISLFGQLGAPKRLTVLVEGESLFNDAAAIVLSRIILGVMAVGAVSGDTVILGGAELFQIFFGGTMIGWALAMTAGMIIGAVEADAFIEITITTILAYLSFYVAEHSMGLSGVMAVVAAGVVMSGWGRAEISPSIAGYLEHFWGYLAEVANNLLFLLVGMTVTLGALVNSLPILFWVVIAMLLSRGLVIFTLVPVVGKLPGSDPIDRRYQTVIYWGGLRGGITLAIALSLPDTVQNKELFITLATGAVLFTLIFQGLTIQRDVPPSVAPLPMLDVELSAVPGAGAF